MLAEHWMNNGELSKKLIPMENIIDVTKNGVKLDQENVFIWKRVYGTILLDLFLTNFKVFRRF